MGDWKLVTISRDIVRHIHRWAYFAAFQPKLESSHFLSHRQDSSRKEVTTPQDAHHSS